MAQIRYSRRSNVFQAHDMDTQKAGGHLVGTLTIDGAASSTYPTNERFSLNEQDTGQGLLFLHDEHEPPKVDIAHVATSHQRRGIGSNLMNLAQAQFGGRIEHSDDISPEAHAWASGRGEHIPSDTPTNTSWAPDEAAEVSDFTAYMTSKHPREDLGGAVAKPGIDRRFDAVQRERRKVEDRGVQKKLF